MDKPLSGKKVAILLSRGFNEADVTESQRALLEMGAAVRIISPDQGIVSGWNGKEWGHHFAVDASLNTALGADYDMLIVPGGIRSLDKLKLTAHSKRFISSFMMAEKPVAIMGDALLLLSYIDLLPGKEVSCPSEIREQVEQAGATVVSKDIMIDRMMMTGLCHEEAHKNYMDAMMRFFVESMDNMAIDQAA